MRLALLVASITLAGSSAHAGSGGLFVPPAEVDIGVGAPVGPAVETVGPSTEILAGLHWASLAWKPTRLDVGIGYVGSFRTIDRTALRAARETGTMATGLDDTLRIHGGYLQIATTLQNHRHWRTWFAARGELLRAYDGEAPIPALGGALRIATELYGSGAGGGNKGFIVGTIGIGVYAEVTYRDVPAELGPHGFTTGLSVRLPLIAIGG